MSAKRLGSLRLAFPVAAAAVILAACSGAAANGLSSATNPPEATASPTPIPTETPIPFAQVVQSGSGSKVTDKFAVPEGNYRVSWSAHSTSSYGGGNIVAYMVGQDKNLLMATQDLNGSTLFQSAGGNFFLEVDAESVSWRIVIDAI